MYDHPHLCNWRLIFGVFHIKIRKCFYQFWFWYGTEGPSYFDIVSCLFVWVELKEYIRLNFQNRRNIEHHFE